MMSKRGRLHRKMTPFLVNNYNEETSNSLKPAVRKKDQAEQCISKKIGNKYGVDKRRNNNGTYKHRTV
ncbi:hypothetical protein CWD84_12650 [Bacillus siamensis]|uniref:Uncharacterized protein n=1 Tax=Bacillus siamensis TaxID=659243 RepID=A0AAI8HP65_9BACI|nr:hypothetical protein CWD84_12650 [Bacillus siamensis]